MKYFTLGGYFGVTDDVILYIRSLELAPPLWLSIKTVVAAPFTYHFANGIRHLVRNIRNIIDTFRVQ